jgi:hypothetical protein
MSSGGPNEHALRLACSPRPLHGHVDRTRLWMSERCLQELARSRALAGAATGEYRFEQAAIGAIEQAVADDTDPSSVEPRVADSSPKWWLDEVGVVDDDGDLYPVGGLEFGEQA